MSEFENSEWFDAEKSKAYREQADHLIQDRSRLLSLLGLFYRNVASGESVNDVLDLGCGDGAVGAFLKSVDRRIRLSAWDGSDQMLASAEKRLRGWSDVDFRCITFQDLLRECRLKPRYNLVVSAFAIHHLDHDEKRGLFAQIHTMLKTGGYFVNIDTAMPEHPVYNGFYDEIWRDWLSVRKNEYGLGDELLNVPENARAKEENKYEPVSVQLRFLKEVGFHEAECWYKAGLFVMYGARK
ncbi:class I SAM-dependent methyltransferase [bacterium]|nr:class I SAM-dependent methyltransferase [bacterium]